MDKINAHLIVDAHGFIRFHVQVPPDMPAGEYEARIIDLVKWEPAFEVFGPIVDKIPGLDEEEVGNGEHSSGIGK